MELCGYASPVEVSLEEAIRHKYCPLVDYSAVASDAFPSAGTSRSITQTALIYKPGIEVVNIGFLFAEKWPAKHEYG